MIDIQSSQARAFNPHLRAASANMQTLIGNITADIQQFEEDHGLRVRSRKAQDEVTFRRMVEAILCDLLAVHEVGKHDALYLPLSNQILTKKSRYKGAALSKRLPEVIKVLKALGVVTVEKGSKTFPEVDERLQPIPAGGVRTTIQPRPYILTCMRDLDLDLQDVREADDEEVIILRAPKRGNQVNSRDVEYDDTPETDSLRRQVKDINAWLAQADITCDAARVNPYQRRLRRIFNNSDFKQGGRLYGGFWQSLDAAIREESISIEGSGCVECDYGQMSVMLLYSLAGAPIPEGDLYDLSAQGIPHAYRKGIKKVIQAIINSSEELSRYPAGAKDLLPKGLKFDTLRSAIRAKHEAIYPLMTGHLGMQMFRKESDILVEVLIALKNKGIVALPIHDAVLVGEHHKAPTQDIMRTVFKDHTGLSPKVS